MTEHGTALPPGEARFVPVDVKRKDSFGWLKQGLRDADARDDLAHGQIVSVLARWILVGAGLMLALWDPVSIGPLRLQVLVLLIIAVANFYLHAQLLRKRSAFAGIAYAASLADLVVITTLVLTQGGYDSNLWVFYFPAVLALSVAFPVELTALFASATAVAYGLICLGDSGTWDSTEQVQVIFTRLLMIAAVAVCGAIYRHVDAERRQVSGTVSFDPMAGLRMEDQASGPSAGLNH
jgi:hypothetical protein